MAFDHFFAVCLVSVKAVGGIVRRDDRKQSRSNKIKTVFVYKAI